MLAHWSRESAHPRLSVAYGALHERVRIRAEELRPHARAAVDDERLGDAARRARDAATEIEHELARLKWLLANRTARNDAADALGPHYDAHTDGAEADTLHELLRAAGRGLC